MQKKVQAPRINPIKTVVLPDYTIKDYPNGLQLIIVNGGVQEVFKLETIFNAGRFHENEKVVSAVTLRMLREGAKNYSSEKIAETIDFYGASLSTPPNLDFSGVTMYGLNQHFAKLLPLYRAVITEPTFTESDLKEYITERKQRLQVDLSKNDVVAYRNITEAVFGNGHPYGYNSNNELYDGINTTLLKEHFNNHYLAGNCTVVISGKINNDIVDRLEQEFFPYIRLGKTEAQPFVINPSIEKYQYYSKPDSVQTAIRIGQKLFNRSHEDYFGLYVLNILLGDYFSSRLMMNIREDKGYTYNIYSILDEMKEDGMFMVSTETANEYAPNTLKEIFFEFEKLQNDLVPQEELEMARSYTMGTMMTALDGPFNASSIIKGLLLTGMDEKHFNKLIHTINTIESKELQLLAQKYLNKDDMYTVLVGK